jgi:hypothetical protein
MKTLPDLVKCDEMETPFLGIAPFRLLFFTQA